MHTTIGYRVEVSERPDPTQGFLGILPRPLSERISNRFKFTTLTRRAYSLKPTPLAEAQAIATSEVEKFKPKKVVEVQILPEKWTILNKRERIRWPYQSVLPTGVK